MYTKNNLWFMYNKRPSYILSPEWFYKIIRLLTELVKKSTSCNHKKYRSHRSFYISYGIYKILQDFTGFTGPAGEWHPCVGQADAYFCHTLTMFQVLLKTDKLNCKNFNLFHWKKKQFWEWQESYFTLVPWVNLHYG